MTWLNLGDSSSPAAAIQAAMAVIGFLIVIYQLFQLRRNLRGATQDRLYAHYMEICKLFMQNPDLRPHFYPDKNSSEAAKSAKKPEELKLADAKVAFMCESIMGLVEHAILQRKNLPKDAWKNCWRKYAEERLLQSEVLRGYFDPNAHWYSLEMGEEMTSINEDVQKAINQRIAPHEANK